MSRLLFASLIVALAGCSGGTVSTTTGPTQRLATLRIPPPRGTAVEKNDTPKAPAGDTRPTDTRPDRTQQQLDALTANLRAGDEGLRLRAAKELQQWGPQAAPATRPLAQVVAGSPAGDLRQAAVEALAAIHPDVATDLRAIVTGGDDPGQRVGAEKHLAQAVAGTPSLAAALEPIIAWRIAALPAEGTKANVGFAVAADEYAALAPLLLKAGPLDDQAFRAVVECAKANPDAGRPLWERAQLTLCETAVGDTQRRKEALDALSKSLESRVSVVSIRAVGAIGPDAKPLVPLLRTLNLDRDERVRRAAAEALKEIEK